MIRFHTVISMIPGVEDLGPVSQKSQNFSGLFRVPQFPLYVHNAEVLTHQTSQSS